jgi:hypothetical protein
MKSEAEIRALDEVLYALENLIVRVNQRFEPNGGLWLPEAIEKAEAALAKARPLAAQPAPNTEESCGTAQAAGISMGEVGPLTAKGVLPLGGLIPEWELLTPTSRANIEKWFDLACQSLQKTLDGPFNAQPAPATVDAEKIRIAFKKMAEVADWCAPMTPADKTLEQMVAEVLLKHRQDGMIRCDCSCGWQQKRLMSVDALQAFYEHVAAELAPLFAWREAEARLQEAFFFDEEILDTCSLAHPATVGDHIRGLRSAADAARAKIPSTTEGGDAL